VICTALLVYFLIRARRGDKDKEEYVSVYDKLRRHRAKVTDTDVTADTEAASADDLVGETLEKEKE
jgi:hypothetical protein